MRRRFLNAAVAALVLVGASGSQVLAHRAEDDAVLPSQRWRQHAISRVDVVERAVALTFDDGPDPRWTPGVLDLLARHDAKATFFLVGEHAHAHPDLVRRIRDEGHEVANHTATHPVLRTLPRDEVRRELAVGDLLIREAGGVPNGMFRPPRGKGSREVQQVAEELGLQTLLWDGCVEKEVLRHGVEQGTTRLLAELRPGSILLAHDGGEPDRAQTMKALPLLLAGLSERGYRSVTASELLRQGGRANPLAVR